jgi:hypothetical protein
MRLISFPEYSTARNMPQYWHEDRTGIMRRAVEYYNRQMCGNAPSLDASYHCEQIEVLRQYFEHYINAPVWNHIEEIEALEELRDTIKDVRSTALLKRWHGISKDIGIDPL